ncbi:phosphotransferase family protein [Leadbettera azotonutricia]|uniref:Aminoglycoside phosphotransferase n=1 Tax=Leadbettera azotonutricia (strain ATCC BAA-888 / DSM 13862 / ZAS-9) TaxID=545695 RepID=F5YA52_LEAAZ|nr:phosphotransferase [Leadbettera azotonutricia]AEF83136.1 aminoglycoside phosphotransferase [Leadbettera azotonutricia ZAS-9]
MKLEKIIAVRTDKTIYLDGNKVVKVMGPSYPASDVLSEALNLACVNETPLKTPKLLEVTQVDGKWAIVWEYIKGKTLAEIMDKDKANFEKNMSRFVDIQLEMHRYKTTRLPLLTEKLQRKIGACGLDASSRYELSTRLASLPKHTKLCHGDFNPSNIIITDKDEAYIIDWSHATQGNASADAAQTYLLFWLSGNIDAAGAYLEKFCKKSDTAKQYVQKWVSIISASQLVKAKPAEKEFLLHWANVVEYE